MIFFCLGMTSLMRIHTPFSITCQHMLIILLPVAIITPYFNYLVLSPTSVLQICNLKLLLSTYYLPE